MNKIKLLYLTLLGLLFGIAACDKMNDVQKEFLDRGETIYVGKIDSLKTFGGNGRIKITGLMYYAYTADKCIVRWEADSLIVPVEGYSVNDTIEIIVDNIDEGTYQFTVQTYDIAGNSSLKEYCSGTVYGSQYLLAASPKLISVMTPEPSGMTLTWNQSEEAESVELVYETDGGDITMQLPGNVAQTVITDWKLGGTVKTRTAVIPEPGAIDTMYTDWITQYFPAFVEYELPKGAIKPLRLANDATTGHGGDVNGVFDGTFSSQFHSGDGVGVAQHLTFDLGVLTNLTRLEMWGRQDNYHNWNPKKIQFWGIEDMTGAEIELPSMDSGWETEAVNKGWTKLMDATCGDPIYNRLNFEVSQKIRYLIIRTTEVHGDPISGSGAYVILREINLFANSITAID